MEQAAAEPKVVLMFMQHESSPAQHAPLQACTCLPVVLSACPEPARHNRPGKPTEDKQKDKTEEDVLPAIPQRQVLVAPVEVGVLARLPSEVVVLPVLQQTAARHVAGSQNQYWTHCCGDSGLCPCFIPVNRSVSDDALTCSCTSCTSRALLLY